MKTFLGFTTGLLGGTIVGMVLMAGMIVADESLREFTNKVADEIDDI